MSCSGVRIPRFWSRLTAWPDSHIDGGKEAGPDGDVRRSWLRADRAAHRRQHRRPRHPVYLRDALGSLDQRNVALITTIITEANG
jgi:hypothetical protein